MLAARGPLGRHSRSTATLWDSFLQLFSLKQGSFPVPFTDGLRHCLYRGITNLPNAQERFWIGVHAHTGLRVARSRLWKQERASCGRKEVLWSWKEKTSRSEEHLCCWSPGRSLHMRTFNVLSFPHLPTDGGRETPFPVQSLQATEVVFPFNYPYMKDYCTLQLLSFLRQFAAEALQSSGTAFCAATA